MRVLTFPLSIVLVLLVTSGCANWLSGVETWKSADGIQMKFRTSGEQFEIFEDEEWKAFFVQGVNLGAAMPGYYPGDMAIDKETYARWFEMMTEMGSNAVRVYTILPPYFYEALVEYNKKNRDRPLYLIQGVWSPEELLIERRDAFDEEIIAMFHQEIEHAVGAVYGDITIEPSPGKASGEYKANAGPYLLAWNIGTEWDPQMVVDTNELHAEGSGYAGRYFQTTDQASPFESWLAELLDLTAGLERERGYEHPIAFTNWVTTDPLTHPGEPTFEEDMVSVDASHVVDVGWGAGYFASYHVYPYYPDLFRFDESLRVVANRDGQIDPYQTYLRKLKEYHADMPVLIAEFGVPSSWGIGHMESLGRNQGGHDEKEQGEAIVSMYHAIVDEGLAGALLFSWQDEWFKRSWNTMRLEVPADHRAYWLNVLSNEQMFGLIGMYASKEEAIVIDGNSDDWDKLPEEEKTKLVDGGSAVTDLWMTHDEAYVYLLVKLDHAFEQDKETLMIGVDTIPGGNRHMVELPGKTLDEGLETLIVIDGNSSEVKIASNYDPLTRLYGLQYKMIPVSDAEMKDDSGVFRPWNLAVGLQMEQPNTRINHPFEDVPAGKLHRGTNDSERPNYDSQAAWEVNGDTIEMRIPWALLGYSDPSTHQAISYRNTTDRTFESITSEGIRLLPWLLNKNATVVMDSKVGGTELLRITNLPVYQWEEWSEVGYVERKKQSYEIVKQAYLERRNKP